jgi:endonuclease/exonuclease/phosphatase family metal-dependent hydrolase
VLAAAAALVAACANAINYTDPAGPRFANASTATPVTWRDTLRVVTFNIAWARQIDRAIALLREDPALAGADVLMLQEMDAAAARTVAESLGLNWVYYPAARYPNTQRDFGNAILSRYPIRDDRKLVLPHLGRGRRSQRVAVGATLVVGDRPVRVYSLHLATLIGNGPNQRREQLRAVLDDAEGHPDVIVAGDFNSETVPGMALERGYRWPTRGLRHTNGLWTFDHVLVRGLAPAGPNATGVIEDHRDTSDHHPVWAVLVRPAARSEARSER